MSVNSIYSILEETFTTKKEPFTYEYRLCILNCCWGSNTADYSTLHCPDLKNESKKYLTVLYTNLTIFASNFPQHAEYQFFVYRHILFKMTNSSQMFVCSHSGNIYRWFLIEVVIAMKHWRRHEFLYSRLSFFPALKRKQNVDQN